MIYLVLSITASTLLFVLFKLFGKYKINSLQAIVVNYITAGFIGLLNSKIEVSFHNISHAPWLFGAVVLAFLFIINFNVMALTAQRNGLSVVSIASKMSVIIPVIFGILIYNETTGVKKLIGMFIALVAVYLTSLKKSTKGVAYKDLLLPFFLFLGSGIIDTSIKYIETTHVSKNGIPLFTATIFFTAFILGLIHLGVKKLKGQFAFSLRNIVGGIILGIINYYCVYYLLKALQHNTLESSTIFTINNVAIVTLSTLIGLLLFKEHISKTNWIGIALALTSIILVTLP